MTCRTTIRRLIKQATAAREQATRIGCAIEAADHFTEADRATAETLEAAEMFAAFIAEEL